MAKKPTTPCSIVWAVTPLAPRSYWKSPAVPLSPVLPPSQGADQGQGHPSHRHLEFRSGGRACRPPTLAAQIPSQPYEWAPGQSLNDLPLPEVPPAIIAAITPLPGATTASLPSADMDDFLVAPSPSTRKFLAGDYAEGPQWNARLFQSACDLHGRGLPLEEAERLLLAGARPWNNTEAETARRTIQSAYSQPREPSHH